MEEQINDLIYNLERIEAITRQIRETVEVLMIGSLLVIGVFIISLLI